VAQVGETFSHGDLFYRQHHCPRNENLVDDTILQDLAILTKTFVGDVQPFFEQPQTLQFTIAILSLI
jgi:hypothetical protein